MSTYVQVNYDTLVGKSSEHYGTRQNITADERFDMESAIIGAIEKWADQFTPFEIHIQDNSEYGYESFHLSFICTRIVSHRFMEAIAKAARLGQQDAIAVIIGHVLCGPGSDHYPTEVK